MVVKAPLDKPAFALVCGKFRLELDDAEVRELTAYALGLFLGMWMAGGFRRVH